MYNGSQLRKDIEGRGGRTLNFPDVADRVAEAINRERMPIHKAGEELPFGSRHVELCSLAGRIPADVRRGPPVKAVEEAFAALSDRQPNDKERQRLMRERDALHLKDNDALWRLLVVLGHYETLYAEIPTRIAQVASDVTDSVRSRRGGQAQGCRGAHASRAGEVRCANRARHRGPHRAGANRSGMVPDRGCPAAARSWASARRCSGSASTSAIPRAGSTATRRPATKRRLWIGRTPPRVKLAHRGTH